MISFKPCVLFCDRAAAFHLYWTPAAVNSVQHKMPGLGKVTSANTQSKSGAACTHTHTHTSTLTHAHTFALLPFYCNIISAMATLQHPLNVAIHAREDGSGSRTRFSFRSLIEIICYFIYDCKPSKNNWATQTETDWEAPKENDWFVKKEMTLLQHNWSVS